MTYTTFQKERAVFVFRKKHDASTTAIQSWKGVELRIRFPAADICAQLLSLLLEISGFVQSALFQIYCCLIHAGKNWIIPDDEFHPQSPKSIGKEYLIQFIQSRKMVQKRLQSNKPGTKGTFKRNFIQC